MVVSFTSQRQKTQISTAFVSLPPPLCLVNPRHSLCGSQMRQTRKNIFGLSMLDLFLFLSIFSAEDQSRWNVPNNPPKGMCDPARCWRLLRLVRCFLMEIRCRHFMYIHVCLFFLSMRAVVTERCVKCYFFGFAILPPPAPRIFQFPLVHEHCIKANCAASQSDGP